MHRFRLRAFHVFVAGVIAAAALVLAVAVGVALPGALTGRRADLYWLFTICFFVAELRPVKWLRRAEGGEVTASWTFAFAVLFVAPAAGAMVAVFGCCLAADLSHRKPVVRSLFNASQIMLSLAVGAFMIAASGQRGRLAGSGGPTIAWTLAATSASIVVFVTNGVLTCVVMALYQEIKVWGAIRKGVILNLSTDGTLIALAPVIVIIALRAPVLLPLLLVTAWAVYRSSVLALSRDHEAKHDLLTALPNRRFLLEELSRRLDERPQDDVMAVALLDLDSFKEINDRLGHHIGDRVLQEVAARLLGRQGPADIVARLGGDEFAILFGAVANAQAARAQARELLDALGEPLSLDGFPLSVKASFGVALFPDHGDTADQLMDRADIAMYEAKNGRTGVHIYPSHVEPASRGRLTMLAELQSAVERDQFVLHYQPKVTLASGDIVGLEALVRWQHPGRGLLLPGQFVPVAEQTDLMGPLTALVLRLALQQAKAWQDQGLCLSVAVNGSARNLHDLRFPSLVSDLLNETGVPASRLELEVTENTVMADPERAKAVLARLRDLGVTISIDDFGTGYSSLAALRQLPVDSLKIDRSFVTDMAARHADAVIVRSIIDLARNLGLGTVAEGIEDKPVLDLLGDYGCEMGQGYFISRPVPASEIPRLIAARGHETVPASRRFGVSPTAGVLADPLVAP